MSADSVLHRNDRLSWRILEGEAVILFPDDGSLHRLNETGTRAWELMDGSRSIGDIAQAISQEFDVDPEAATADLVEVAASLVSAGLAEVAG